MITYPDENYNSYIDLAGAENYFEYHMKADLWESCQIQENALITAFRSLAELNLDIDLTDEKQFELIKAAQCEQVLHELDLLQQDDLSAFESLAITGLMNIKTKSKQKGKYSDRAISLLKPYIVLGTVKRTR